MLQNCFQKIGITEGREEKQKIFSGIEAGKDGSTAGSVPY
jgi:hypothetical protein